MKSQNEPLAGINDLTSPYLRIPDTFDEMIDDNNVIRDHWKHIVQSYSIMGVDELEHRNNEVRRMVRETGDESPQADLSSHLNTSWSLDLMPALITSKEWSHIELGLSQRCEIFNLILSDIYGEKKLIKEGIIPPELVFSCPGYFRSCYQKKTGNNFRLYFYTADLARAQSGEMMILNDHIQNPAGLGYALKNRMILSRVFPSLFRDCHVHRLARFFRNLRMMLLEAGRTHSDNPCVVMLTAGPGDEGYFEYSFLANYLGLFMVQAGDLTVRDNRVYIKTLDGLQTVDVIFRQSKDYDCDPLDLDPDSQIGVPGILQSALSGNVILANPLGSGILENPGFFPFLPAICRFFLGEDLHIPTVPTWWCGQKNEMDYVINNLKDLVIKPVDPNLNIPVMFGSTLTNEQRQILIEQIKTRPNIYIGQEYAPGSTTPVYSQGMIYPQRSILRSYLVTRHEEHIVMPGGLTRIAPQSPQMGMPFNNNGITKDTWLLASEPEEKTSLTEKSPQLAAVHSAVNSIPSRIAENLFWFGRYSERTESNARMLHEVIHRLLDTEALERIDYLPFLFKVVADQTDHPYDDSQRLESTEQELLEMVFDVNRIGGLPFNINALIKTARAIRDRLSEDAFRFLSALNLPGNMNNDMDNALDVLEHIIFVMSALSGLAAESMTRGRGHNFLMAGKRIERGLNTLTLLQSVFLHDRIASAYLCEMTLSMNDSMMTYRRRYRTTAQPQMVIDLLLFNESNPRSVGYQIAGLQDCIHNLETTQPYQKSTGLEKIVMKTLTEIRTADVDLGPLSSTVYPAELDGFINTLRSYLLQLSDEVSHKYFELIEKHHRLVDIA